MSRGTIFTSVWRIWARSSNSSTTRAIFCELLAMVSKDCLNIRGRHAGMIFEQQIRVDEDVGERGLEIMGDCVGERVQFLVALLELRQGSAATRLQPACALQFDSSTRCLYRAPSRRRNPSAQPSRSPAGSGSIEGSGQWHLQGSPRMVCMRARAGQPAIRPIVRTTRL